MVNQGTSSEVDSNAQQQQQHIPVKPIKRRGSPRADQALSRISRSHRESREMHRERQEKDRERDVKDDLHETSPSPHLHPYLHETSPSPRLHSSAVGHGSAEPELRLNNPMWQPRRELVRLLFRHRFAVLSALCDAIQAQQIDKFARCLYTICEVDSSPRVAALMQWAVARELATQPPDQLFRSGTVSTRLLSQLFRTKGAAYLHAVVQPLVRRLLQPGNEAEASLELDPARASGLPAGVLAARQQRLCALARDLLEDAVQHVPLLPPELRRLFVYTKKHHTKQHSMVMGAVFFLRFLCPPIVAPDGYRLCSAYMSPQLRRSLVLVSKLLQSLANAHLSSNLSGPAPDSKEPYMCELTQRFIEEHMSLLQILYARLLRIEGEPAARSVQRSSSLPSAEVLAVRDPEAAIPLNEAVATINCILRDLRNEVARELPRHLGVERCSGVQGSCSADSEGPRALPAVKRALLDSLHAELAHHHLTAGHATSTVSVTLPSPRGTSTGVPTRAQLLESELRLLETKLRAETRTRRALESKLQEMRARLDEQNRLVRALAQRLSRYEEVAPEYLSCTVVPSPREDSSVSSDSTRITKSRSEVWECNRPAVSRSSLGEVERVEQRRPSLAPRIDLSLSALQSVLQPPPSCNRMTPSPGGSFICPPLPLRRHST